MGTRGPVPKRSDQRRRRNATDPMTTAAGAADVEAPTPSDEWHPVARLWFDSLAESGQSRFYEPSDWATAFLIAESLSLDLKPQFVGFAQTGRDETQAEFAVVPLKGASLSAYLKAMGDLMTTEGARRRLRMELQRPDEAAANVVQIDWRARASAGA